MVKERLSEAEVLLHICIIAILQQMKKKKKLSVRSNYYPEERRVPRTIMKWFNTKPSDHFFR